MAHQIRLCPMIVCAFVALCVLAAIAIPNAAAQAPTPTSTSTPTSTPTPTNTPTPTPNSTPTPTDTPTSTPTLTPTSTPAPWTTTNTAHFSIEWCSDNTGPDYPAGSGSSGFDADGTPVCSLFIVHFVIVHCPSPAYTAA